MTTKFAHVHEQSEFTYGGYLVAAEHLYELPFGRGSSVAKRKRWEVVHVTVAFLLLLFWPLHDIVTANIVYGVWLTQRGSGGGRILRISRAIVLQ